MAKDYRPKNAQSPAATISASKRDYAGYGPTDGVQSEGSTSEARKLLGDDSAGGNQRVETGWSKKTRYTGDSNAG